MIFSLWIRPAHLDDESQRPEPQVAAQAPSEGINVERVLSEEMSVTLSNDDVDGGDGGGVVDVASGSGGYHGGNGGGGLPYDPWIMESGYQATQDEDHGARNPVGRYVH